jgi:hypothetical protein
LYGDHMATWEDVNRIALDLPDTVQSTDTNGYKWEVHKKYFAYERPLRKRDLEALGNEAPSGPILGVRVAELDDKRGLICSNPEVFFTIPHYANYPAVLVLLEKISLEQLGEVITDAWLCRAPKRLAAAFLEQERGAHAP